ncbi:MAG: hypothetical protein RR630_05145 [Coprobacillus sp.]
MFEKMGIRIGISVLFVWFILSIDIVSLKIDGFIFSMIVLYSILLSLIIEISYSLLRKYLQYMPYISFIMIIMVGITYLYWGWGMYVGFTAYVVSSLIFDLYREYKMYTLLKKALEDHSIE